jgi:hypothetical protein
MIQAHFYHARWITRDTSARLLQGLFESLDEVDGGGIDAAQ